MKMRIILLISTFVFISSCTNDDRPEFPVIYENYIVRDEIVLKQYPELEGSYVLSSLDEVIDLEQKTNNSLLLEENLENFDFEENVIIGVIGSSKVQEVDIIFSPILETELITVNWYEVKQDLNETELSTQAYYFGSLKKSDKEIIFKKSNN